MRSGPATSVLPARPRRVVAAAALAGVAATWAQAASAQPPISGPTIPQPTDEKLSSWDQGLSRPFVAGRFDVGVIFARPAIMAGYGKPHWQWFGVEAYALTTNSFFASYAGTRASLPFIDITIGLRDTYAYRRSFLPRKDAYVADDVDKAWDGHARYRAIDSEMVGLVPAPGGYLLWGVLGTTVLNAPSGLNVYEEGMRVIMRRPFAIDFRLGYVAALGTSGFAKVGALTETVVMPGRDGPVFRVGPVSSISISDHTEGIFIFTVVANSPDSLGIWHGTYGMLGLRYRWALGETSPAFP